MPDNKYRQVTQGMFEGSPCTEAIASGRSLKPILSRSATTPIRMASVEEE